MKQAISLVFPHQLYEENPCVSKSRRVYLMEDQLFFHQVKFHRKKLLLHRASMRFYEDYLKSKAIRVSYIDQKEVQNLESFFKKVLYDEGVKEIHVCDPTDFLLMKRLNNAAEKFDIQLIVYENPNFFNARKDNEEALIKSGRGHYFMADFYKKQRIRLNILMDGDKPMGGKWSFDTDNRQALPKGIHIPFPEELKESHYVTMARKSIREEFPDNPGEDEFFNYAVTHEEARQVLRDFIDHRFFGYGRYQDAMSYDQPFVFHSVIASALNIGLIQPHEVVETVLNSVTINEENFSAVEGFIRQVIGWREFVRAMYDKHSVLQRTRNYWNAFNKLDVNLLNEIKPFKKVHDKLLKYGYAHHIERLMVQGNLMLLARIHPDEVYRYFMTYYIDAYDWVMVPNVYGMSLHADGGLMTTKPYISGSNYLNKQGLPKEEQWSITWDALFWEFIDKERVFFSKNPRTNQMVANYNRMKDDKKLHLKEVANTFQNRFGKIKNAFEVVG
jgi:deoxyribodipyrimidine photolyase-related protein